MLEVSQGREAKAAGGLHDHLHALHEELHRGHQFGVRDSENVSDLLANDREGVLTQMLGLGAVGDGDGRVDVHDAAALEGALAVVPGFGLDPVYEAIGRQRTGGQRGAGEHAATTQADKQRVQRAGELQQLLRGSALAGQHVRVVEGGDQGHAVLLGECATNLLAVFGDAVIEHHPCTVFPGSGDLRGGGVGGHHDGCRHLQQPRGQRDALRMITRGKRHDASLALLLIKTRQRIEGAAKLERAGALQVFALDKHLGAGLGIEGTRGEHRRAVGEAFQALGGFDYVMVGRRWHGRDL